MWKKHRLTLIVIFFSVLAVRLWFLHHIRTDPAFYMPVGDSKEFNFWAFQIANGEWLWSQLHNHTPLYAYFLAMIYKVFGFKVGAVALIQCFLGAVGACLMFLLALRLTGYLSALVCALFMAVYWLFIYTQIYLFSESLAMFLNIVLISYLTFGRDHFRKFLLSGFLFGLSLICRPDILAFALTVWWGIFRPGPDRKKAPFFFFTFLSGAFLVLSPVLIRNHQLTGDWLFREQIGANFYIGNDPGLLGSNIFLEEGRSWQRFSGMPYREKHPERILSEPEINDFYFRSTYKNIQEKPLRWLALISGKLFAIMTGREFLRPEDVYFRDIYVRNTPVILLSTHIIFVLALGGLLISWREREKYRLVYALLLSALCGVFFPAKTVYLVPVMPFVILFSALSISFMYHAVIENNKDDRIKVYLILLCLGLFSSLNPLKLQDPTPAERYYAMAINFQALKNYELAEESFQKALAIDPLNCSAWNDLAILYLSRGHYNKALYSFGKAKDIDPVYGKYYERTLALIKDGRPASEVPVRIGGSEVAGAKEYLEFFHYP